MKLIEPYSQRRGISGYARPMRGKWLISAAALLLLGCSEKEVAEDNAQYVSAWEVAMVSSDVQEKWQRSCALCHVGGEGGAPRMGDPGSPDWIKALAHC